jgi:hypothetical protein
MPLYNPTNTKAYSANITGTMTTTSASITDLTVSGLSNTQIQSIDFPSVSLAGASAGWTFTPTRIGVLQISAQVQVIASTASNSTVIIADGSNVALSAGAVSNMQNSGETQTVTVVGFLNITSLSAVTVKIRASITSGTLTVSQAYIAANY